MVIRAKTWLHFMMALRICKRFIPLVRFRVLLRDVLAIRTNNTRKNTKKLQPMKVNRENNNHNSYVRAIAMALIICGLGIYSTQASRTLNGQLCSITPASSIRCMVISINNQVVGSFVMDASVNIDS